MGWFRTYLSSAVAIHEQKIIVQLFFINFYSFSATMQTWELLENMSLQQGNVSICKVTQALPLKGTTLILVVGGLDKRHPAHQIAEWTY
ncbi:MAG: hypothetical protein ACLPX5_08705 [Dissulfurispiraceae bacterium]